MANRSTFPQRPTLFVAFFAVLFLSGASSCLAQESLGHLVSESAEAAPSLRQGIDAYESGNLELAEKHFIDAAKHRDSKGFADYYLALVYAEEHLKSARKAGHHIKRALDADANNPYFIAERLRQLDSDESFFGTQAIRQGEIARLIERLNQVGGGSAEQFRMIGAIFTSQFTRFRTASPTSQGRSGLYFTNANNWNVEKALGALKRAEQAYRQAIDLDPHDFNSYQDLLKLYLSNVYAYGKHSKVRHLEEADSLTQAMRKALPDQPWPWLYRGMVMSMSGRPALASNQYAMGIGLLDVQDRERLLQPLSSVTPEKYDRPGWPIGFEDPLLTTPENEADVFHLTRVMYADMFFPGWRNEWNPERPTTPGAAVIKFGIPETLEQRIRPIMSSARRDVFPGGLLMSLQGQFFRFDGNHDQSEWTLTYDDNPILYEFLSNNSRVGDRLPQQEIEMPLVSTLLRNHNGEPEVLSSFGIFLPRNAGSGAVPISIQTSQFFLDPEGEILGASSTQQQGLQVMDTYPFDTLRVWVGNLTTTFEPGNYELRFEALSRDLVSIHSTSLPISDLDGLEVSQPILALSVEEVDSPESATSAFFRNGISVRPSATNIFRRTEPIYVYFETYGLTKGEDGSRDYTVEVILSEADSNQGMFSRLSSAFSDPSSSATSIRFTTTTTEDRGSDYVILDAEDVEPGQYEVGVRITDSTNGLSDVSSRRLMIVQ